MKDLLDKIKKAGIPVETIDIKVHISDKLKKWLDRYDEMKNRKDK